MIHFQNPNCYFSDPAPDMGLLSGGGSQGLVPCVHGCPQTEYRGLASEKGHNQCHETSQVLRAALV